MADPVARFATRLAYGATQLTRVAWYVGHDMLMRRLSQAQQVRNARRRRRAHTDRPVPDRRQMYADMARLFRQDLANVEAGIYPLPADHDGSLPIRIDRSFLFFTDIAKCWTRRLRESGPNITCKIFTSNRAAG
jgi:hypothetical protein